jgi:stage II sporulation protein E
MPKGTVVILPADGTTPSSNLRLRRSLLEILVDKTSLFLTSLFHYHFLPLNIIALLLSRVTIMGELAPFGLAFFAAVSQAARERALPVAVWATVGVFSTGRYMEGCLYSLAIVAYFRFAGKLMGLKKKFQAVPFFIFIVVAFGGTLLGIIQGATLYSYMTVMFDAIICIVMAYIFMSGVTLLTSQPGQRQVTGEMLLCLVILLAGAVAGLGTVSVAGYSFRNIVGSFIIMVLAMGGGTGIGTSVGVLVGLVIGLTDENASIIIILYAVAGLMAGVFRSLGKFAVILGFMLGSVISLLYFSQVAQLVQLLTEAAFAATIFAAIPMAWLQLWSKHLREQPAEQSLMQPVREAAAKLESVAEIFRGLAATVGCRSIENGVKIREEETARVLSAIGEQVCGSCGQRAACWERDFYRTYRAVLDSIILAEQTELSTASLPQILKDCCIHQKELLWAITKAAELNHAFSFWQRKMDAVRETVTEQMKAVGAVTHNLAQELNREAVPDSNLAESIKQKSALCGCPIESIRLIGHDGIVGLDIHKAPCKGNRECINTILPLASALLREKLTLHADCGGNKTNGMCRLQFKVADNYAIQTGMASKAKESQEVCGDACAVIPLGKGKIALILSDGMGSGTKAAGESTETINYMKKLLQAGFDIEVAVKTVNSMLLLKDPDESFATVDIAVIDTFAGEAEFLKVGSAPSFVKRVREVATIKSAALPVGILHQIEIEPVKWLLATGDILVMVSDGILDVPCRGTEKEPWIVNFLRRLNDGHPQEIADIILQQAMGMAGMSIQDDMTVLVAKVVERPGLEH